jgi:hypothetical protein
MIRYKLFGSFQPGTLNPEPLNLVLISKQRARLEGFASESGHNGAIKTGVALAVSAHQRKRCESGYYDLDIVVCKGVG